jgi:hypothetical protein
MIYRLQERKRGGRARGIGSVTAWRHKSGAVIGLSQIRMASHPLLRACKACGTLPRRKQATSFAPSNRPFSRYCAAGRMIRHLKGFADPCEIWVLTSMRGLSTGARVIFRHLFTLPRRPRSRIYHSQIPTSISSTRGRYSPTLMTYLRRGCSNSATFIRQG